MLEAIRRFFDSRDFMPHGHCFLWYPEILWLHVVSDAIIALAYYAIPFVLVYFIRKRSDTPFQFLFYCFGAFIILCGTTHLISIWVFWYPQYALEGIVKALTALVSIVTAVLTWRIMPIAILFKSPSELARINDELKEAYTSTERKVQERTAELVMLTEQLQKEVEEKQKALTDAEQASRAKSEFLGNMSHEIRTPMNAVVGLANLLQQENLPRERQKEFVETLLISSQSLMQLINDLLDISKLEEAQVQIERIPFRLSALIEEVISIMSVKAQEKGIGLVAQYEPREGDSFLGDPLRIRQVLMNLISNAVKFTERGAVTVHVDYGKPQDDKFHIVSIDVKDTGIGIKPEKLETIFDKFTQADTSITRKFGGTGLGLSITKTLVELMGGAISVVSTFGLGSKFIVEIPLLPVSAASTAEPLPPLPSLPPPTQQANESQAPCILLVEDLKANILVAKSTIEFAGYRCDVAENGLQALEKVKQTRYDAIVMDVQMPVMDGIQATKLIRQFEKDQRKPKTPILGVTAYTQHRDRQECLAAGMDDFLTKPFDPEELKKRLAALLAALR